MSELLLEEYATYDLI